MFYYRFGWKRRESAFVCDKMISWMNVEVELLASIGSMRAINEIFNIDKLYDLQSGHNNCTKWCAYRLHFEGCWNSKVVFIRIGLLFVKWWKNPRQITGEATSVTSWYLFKNQVTANSSATYRPRQPKRSS